MSTGVVFLPGSPSCPGCRAGDHQKCDGGAWDLDTDQPTHCRCAADNHGRPPARTVDEELADIGEDREFRHTRLGAFDL